MKSTSSFLLLIILSFQIAYAQRDSIRKFADGLLVFQYQDTISSATTSWTSEEEELVWEGDSITDPSLIADSDLVFIIPPQNGILPMAIAGAQSGVSWIQGLFSIKDTLDQSADFTGGIPFNVSLLDSNDVLLLINNVLVEDSVNLVTVCESDSIRLSVDQSNRSDSATYEWFIDNNTLGEGLSFLQINDSIMLELTEDFQLDTLFNVKVLVNDNGLCETSLNLVFNSQPTFTLTDQTESEIGDTIRLCSNSLPDTFLISTNGNIEATVTPIGMKFVGNEAFVITDSIIDSEVSLIFQVINGACSIQDTLTILVDDLEVDLGIDSISVCADSIILDSSIISHTPIGEGKWSILSGPGGLLFSTGDTLINTILLVQEEKYGTHMLIWEENLGSCSSSDTLQITFNRPLQAEILSPSVLDTSFCQDRIQLIALQPPTEDSGRWYIAEQEFADIIPDTANQILDLKVQEFGLYTVIWEVSNPVCKNPVTDTLRIDFINSQPAEAGLPTDTVCGDTYTLEATPVRGRGVWIWEDTSNIALSDSLDPKTQAIAAIPGTYDLIWKSGGDICITRDTITISFRPVPQAIAGMDTTICMGETLQLGTTGSENNKYLWRPEGLLSDPTISDPLSTPMETTTFTLLVFDPDSICQATDEITLSVIPTDLGIETINLNYNNEIQTLSCGSIPDTLNGEGTILLDFLADNENVVVGWMLEEIEGEINILADQRQGINIISQPIQFTPQNSLIKLSYRAWAGLEECPPQDSSCTVELIIISDISEINIPGIITPNGDGYNDQWVLENASLKANYKVKVFNRQGAMVYQSDNYQNDWDGGTLPDGVYWYIINTQQGPVGTYEGALLIQRNPR